MEPQVVLRSAKEILLSQGWIQGDEVRWNESKATYEYCLVGALGATVAFRPGASVQWSDYKDAYQWLTRALDSRESSWAWIYDSPIEFNDANDRTLDEVIELIDRAIALCAAEKEKENDNTVALPDPQEGQHADPLAEAAWSALVGVEAGEVTDAEGALVPA